MKSRLHALLGAATAAALMALPTAASAQIFPGDLNSPLAATPCKLDIFASFTAIGCAGFYDGNAISGGTGAAPSAQAQDALAKLGASSSAIVLKVDSWNGSAAFGTTMFGLTVVGMHWGNYLDPVNNATGNGNVSAFYLFDFGSGGTNSLALKTVPAYTQGISNFAILSTCVPGANNNCGGGGTFSTVPEPSTYALMAAGLAALGLVARRRRAKV